MKYKVCSMLLAAALAFFPVAGFRQGRCSGDRRGLPGSNRRAGIVRRRTFRRDGQSGRERRKGRRFDAENSDAAGTVGEEEITAVEDRWIFQMKLW